MSTENQIEQPSVSAPAVASGELLSDLRGPHEGDGRGNIYVPAKEWGFIQSLLAGQMDLFVVLGKTDFEGDDLLAITLSHCEADSIAEKRRHPGDDEVAYDAVDVKTWRLGAQSDNEKDQA